MQSTVNTVTRTWAPPAGVAYTGTYNPFDDCDLINPAANSKRPGQVSCGPSTTRCSARWPPRTTNYDPEVVEGWHVRPNNWEIQVSIQRELVPRVSVYAGYTRRWFGNLQATRNLNVTNADFTQYCIPVPADSRLENGGTQQCGLYDVNRVIAPNNLIFNSSKIGGIDDVYDGFDFDVNARLARRMILSGGVSIGRERVNTCNLVDDLSLTQTGRQHARSAHRRVLQRDAAVAAAGEGAGRVSAAVGHQSLGHVPEPVGPLLARSTLDQRAGRAVARPELHRRAADGGPDARRQPLRRPRVPDRPPRFSKQIRNGATVIRPTVSIYNLFNANPVQTYNHTYGATWLNPTVIMQARFVDIGVQVDF